MYVYVYRRELPLLGAWPWEEYCVHVFNIENEPPPTEPSTLPALRALLEPRGYMHRCACVYVYVYVLSEPKMCR